MKTGLRAFDRPRWVEPAARAGFVAKGVVYALVGGLAVLAATGNGGELGGGDAAVQTIAQQPFAQVLLTLTGIGLLGYALWRFVQAALDPERVGRDAKGMVKRIGYAGSGVMHAALGVTALQLAFGNGGGAGGEARQRSLLGDVMQWDGGPALVAIAGVFVIGFALRQIYRAWTTRFTEDLQTQRMSATERTWAVRIGRIGLASRGVVFTIIGIGLLKAGIDADPNQARGVGGALRDIASQPLGVFLLLIVAVGLVAYGIYQFVNARYRQIPVRGHA